MVEDRRLCLPHQRERENAIAAARSAQEREAARKRSRRVAAAEKPRWINISDAPARLRSAGVPKVEVWSGLAEPVVRHTWYGRRWESVHHKEGSGWIIGEMSWEHPERWNVGAGTALLTTVLVDPMDRAPHLKFELPVIIPVRYDSDSEVYASLSSDIRLRPGYELIVADRILCLLGE
jgi:hypothetical protein